MSISIGSDYLNTMTANSASAAKSERLSLKLQSADFENATDEELYDACKSFEAYLVEQMLEGMEKTIPKDEDEEKENSYLKQFGSMFYTSMAEQIADNGELGLARELYESMKRNG